MGPYDHLVGELWPGAYGWLPLDDGGTPSGPATIEPPPEGSGQLACHVYSPVPPEEPTANPPDLLVTPTGAPITDNMTPNADNRAALETQYKSAPKPPGWHPDRKPRFGNPK